MAKRKPRKRKAKRYTFSPEAQDALVVLIDLMLKTQGAEAFELVRLVVDSTKDAKK